MEKNQPIIKAEGIVHSQTNVELNTQSETESSPFTINQSPIDNYILPNSSDLPASSWEVIIKTNLIEIESSLDMKVYVYESDFGKQTMESIAIGQDIDYYNSNVVQSLLRRRENVKAKFKQLKEQLQQPKVGNVAWFETLTDNHLQKVFVVFTPKYSMHGMPAESKMFHDDLYGCYLKLFHEIALTTDIEFLAVSFLKTGNRGTSFEEGAAVFLNAINTFTTDKNPECRLKQIHLILNNDTNALYKIKSALEQKYKDIGNLIHMHENVDKKALAMVGKVDKKALVMAGFKTKMSQKKDMPPRDRNIAEKAKNRLEEKPKPGYCAICLKEVKDNNKKILHKCKHEFCKECIDNCFEHKPVCPTCGIVYGIVTGNQPTGTMHVVYRPHAQLQGHNEQGCYMITYNFYSGKQTAEHSNPGQFYRGTSRKVYLPANEKGTTVMKLLEIAFERKLVFTIGNSKTTGEENVVTWNNIHHKTSMSGGAQGFGYPDPEYLDLVLEELAAKGVTENDLKG